MHSSSQLPCTLATTSVLCSSCALPRGFQKDDLILARCCSFGKEEEGLHLKTLVGGSHRAQASVEPLQG